MHLIYFLPTLTTLTFVAVWVAVTWWFEEVSARTRRIMLGSVGGIAILTVTAVILTATFDRLGWIDVAMPYDEPPPLTLPETSAPPPSAGPAPKLESKTRRATIDEARGEHEREVERFEADPPRP